MINCDSVFSILTRGPFPTGEASDFDVEDHLDRCRDCRRLAEALRPTPHQGPEAVDSDEGWQLPVYWSEHGDASASGGRQGVVATAQAAVDRLVRRVRRRRRPLVDPIGLRMLISLVVGIGFGFLWREASELEGRPSTRAAEARNSVENRFLRQAPRQTVECEILETMGLAPAECYRAFPLAPRPIDDRGPQLFAPRYAEIECCSKCHHAGGSQAKAGALATVARTCGACHFQEQHEVEGAPESGRHKKPAGLGTPPN